MKLLFLLKRNHEYGSGRGPSSGLLNSARFASEMLNANGFMSDVVLVTDGNDIDREVTKARPNVVVIEALWVTPTKLGELRRLHPRVKWIVRYHSDIPFLGLESVAFEWLKEYVRIANVFVAANRESTFLDFSLAIAAENGPAGRILYLPTYYPRVDPPRHLPIQKVLRISCPGAIRPFKNHLNQALAAIRLSEWLNKPLEFYVNASRVEQGGAAVLSNLRALFSGNPRLKLVEEPWLSHRDFVLFLGGMDLVMQVSFNETFNICAADAVAAGTPIVVSPEVSWAPREAMASPTDVTDIFHRGRTALLDGSLGSRDVSHLTRWSEEARVAWVKGLRSI